MLDCEWMAFFELLIAVTSRALGVLGFSLLLISPFIIIIIIILNLFFPVSC